MSSTEHESAVNQHKHISRREMLKGMIRGGAGLAAMGAIAEFSILGEGDPKRTKENKASTKGNAIPEEYLRLYKEAAEGEGIEWEYLAAIGKKETDHGRSNLPGVKDGINKARCCRGPMQFNTENGPKSTWDEYGGDYDGDGDVDVYSPGDAIYAAAVKLRRDGINRNVARALKRYNNSDEYVQDVLDWAAKYRDKYGN